MGDIRSRLRTLIRIVRSATVLGAAPSPTKTASSSRAAATR